MARHQKTAKSQFHYRVYRIVRRIPRGKVMTYMAVARAAGSPRAYRAVGNIMNRNLYPVGHRRQGFLGARKRRGSELHRRKRQVSARGDHYPPLTWQIACTKHHSVSGGEHMFSTSTFIFENQGERKNYYFPHPAFQRFF